MRALAMLLVIALLAGCYTSGKRGSERGLAIYDLGLSPARLVDGERPGILAVEVRAPLWMDTLGINYRLAYADAAQLREYGRSRWAGPPARMIEQQLMRQLDLAPPGQAHGKCVLRIEVGEFSQVFAGPGDSMGVLQGRAYWLDPARHRLAERRLDISRPAATADARGGIGALQETVDQLARELWAWEQQLVASGQAQACAD